MEDYLLLDDCTIEPQFNSKFNQTKKSRLTKLTNRFAFQNGISMKTSDLTKFKH